MNAIIQWAIRALAGISAKQWLEILSYVMKAQGAAEAGEDKKAWALKQLARLGIKGSVANFLVESAVAFLKKKGAIK